MCFSNNKILSPQRRGGAENSYLYDLRKSLSFRQALGRNPEEEIMDSRLDTSGMTNKDIELSSASPRLRGKFIFLLFGLFLVFAGCGGMADDLDPSGADKRPIVAIGTSGTQVGQTAPDLAIVDSLGNTRTLSSELAALAPGNAVVLYFTMWCPICDSHQSHMLSSVIPAFPGSKYFLVDYVSGSIGGTRQVEVSNGYSGSLFTALADTDMSVLNLFNATMSTTVVIDSSGVVRMNEDYKDGSRLMETLKGL